MKTEAQKIAERVPLPEPVVLAEHRFNWPEVTKIEGYTAAQMEALRLAVAEESLRGAEKARVRIDFPGIGIAGPFDVADGEISLPDITMSDLARHFRMGYVTAAPAGSVEVTDVVIERVAIAIASRDLAPWFDGPAEKAWPHAKESTRNEYRAMARKAIEALTAAPDPKPAPEAALLRATRRLVFAARTSGGTAGRDDDLCAALDAIEPLLPTPPSPEPRTAEEPYTDADPFDGGSLTAQAAMSGTGPQPAPSDAIEKAVRHAFTSPSGTGVVAIHYDPEAVRVEPAPSDAPKEPRECCRRSRELYGWACHDDDGPSDAPTRCTCPSGDGSWRVEYQYQTVTNGWHDLPNAADAERYKVDGWPVRKVYICSEPSDAPASPQAMACTLDRMSQDYDTTGRVAEAAALRMAAMLVRREREGEPASPQDELSRALESTIERSGGMGEMLRRNGMVASPQAAQGDPLSQSDLEMVADNAAAWALAELAVECGAEDCATDGQPQTWALGVEAFTELARRLGFRSRQGVAQGDVEDAARLIYDAMRYDREGSVPAWVPGGNSLAQDVARTAARRLASAQPATAKPAGAGGVDG